MILTVMMEIFIQKTHALMVYVITHILIRTAQKPLVDNSDALTQQLGI